MNKDKRKAAKKLKRVDRKERQRSRKRSKQWQVMETGRQLERDRNAALVESIRGRLPLAPEDPSGILPLLSLEERSSMDLVIVDQQGNELKRRTEGE